MENFVAFWILMDFHSFIGPETGVQGRLSQCEFTCLAMTVSLGDSIAFWI
jgi:hypothetical protein